MNSKEIRNKLLGLFPLDAQQQIQPLIDSLVIASKREGTLQGRNEAATMFEMMVLGNDGFTADDINKMIDALRNGR